MAKTERTVVVDCVDSTSTAAGDGWCGVATTGAMVERNVGGNSPAADSLTLSTAAEDSSVGGTFVVVVVVVVVEMLLAVGEVSSWDIAEVDVIVDIVVGATTVFVDSC